MPGSQYVLSFYFENWVWTSSAFRLKLFFTLALYQYCFFISVIMKLLRPAGPPTTFAPLGRTSRSQQRITFAPLGDTHFDSLLKVIANVGENIQGEYGDVRDALFAEVAAVWKWIRKHYFSIPHDDATWSRTAQTFKRAIHMKKLRLVGRI